MKPQTYPPSPKRILDVQLIGHDIGEEVEDGRQKQKQDQPAQFNCNVERAEKEGAEQKVHLVEQRRGTATRDVQAALDEAAKEVADHGAEAEQEAEVGIHEDDVQGFGRRSPGKKRKGLQHNKRYDNGDGCSPEEALPGFARPEERTAVEKRAPAINRVFSFKKGNKAIGRIRRQDEPEALDQRKNVKHHGVYCASRLMNLYESIW